MTLYMKKVFHDECIFTIRITHLGPSLCLLDDLIEGEVSCFIEE